MGFTGAVELWRGLGSPVAAEYPASGSCVGKRLTDVLCFEIREIRQQIVRGPASRERFDDHADRHAHTPNAGFSAHDLRVSGDAFEVLHVP